MVAVPRKAGVALARNRVGRRSFFRRQARPLAVRPFSALVCRCRQPSLLLPMSSVVDHRCGVATPRDQIFTPLGKTRCLLFSNHRSREKVCRFPSVLCEHRQQNGPCSCARLKSGTLNSQDVRLPSLIEPIRCSPATRKSAGTLTSGDSPDEPILAYNRFLFNYLQHSIAIKSGPAARVRKSAGSAPRGPAHCHRKVTPM